jgi:hypothetical protein
VGCRETRLIWVASDGRAGRRSVGVLLGSRERELGQSVELDAGSTGFKVLRGRESVVGVGVGVGKGVGFPIGGGGDGGEGRIWSVGDGTVERGRKMNLNEPAFSNFLVLKNEKQLHVEKRRKRDGQKAHVYV